MAKSRVHPRGATRGRMKPKMLGKGCSTFNRRVKKSTKRRVHIRLPGTK